MHSGTHRRRHNKPQTRTAARAVVEQMEGRDLLSGTLTIAPTNVASVILDVAPNGGIITIYDGNQTTYSPNQFSAVNVTTKLSNESLEIRASVVPINVSCTVPGPVQFDGTSGLTKINANVKVDCLSGVTHIRVDDTNDATPRNATVGWGPGSYVGVKNLAPAEIDYINAGPVDIITGGGSDSLNVSHVESSNTMTVRSSDGEDNVTIGGSIAGPVSVFNTPWLTHLTVDDSANNFSGDSVTVGGGGSNDTITGMTGGTVNFNPNDMAEVTLKLPTAGPSTVSVLRTDKPLNIVGNYSGFTDKITVGSGTGMTDINAAVYITNTSGGAENLELNDKGDPSARSPQVYSTAVSGLSTASVEWATNSVLRLDVDTPSVGGNAVVVRSTGPETHINGKGLVGWPNDTVTVADNQSLQGINGPLYITNSGYSNLTLDDSADSTARSITLTTAPANDPSAMYPYGLIKGLGNAYIYFRAADVTSPVSINCGSGGNTVNIEDTPTTITNGQFGPTLNLYTGAGFDTVNIHGTGKGTTLNLEGQAAIDTVNIGLAGNTQKILGTVNLSNNASYDQLTIDDSSDTTPRSITLDALPPLQGLNTPRGTLTGIAPGIINYDAIDMEDPITILAGSGGNTVVVNNTPNKLVGLLGGNTINFSTGTGTDQVTVKAVGPGTTLNLNGQNGSDSVTVGNNGNVQGILGTVNISNTVSYTNLTVDDSANPAQRIVTLGVFNVGASPVGNIVGLAPGVINFVASDVTNPTIKGGSGGNIFTVTGTPTNALNGVSGPTIDLYTGAGDDIVTVQGMGTGTGLYVNGQDGSDSCTMDYSTGNIAPSHTFTFDGNLPGANQNSFTLKGASPQDTFTLTNGLSTHGVSKDSFTNTYNLYLNTGTFNVNGPMTLLGLVAQTSATTVNFNTTQTIGTLYVNGAKATTAPGGTTSLSLKKLIIDNNGSLDLADNSMLISYSNNPDPIASVRQYLASGYNAGTWTGKGIASSVAANNPAHNTGLGYADSNDGTGINPTPNSIQIKYALYGDTNLDGSVDVFDLNNLLPHFNKPGSWTGGDFNYDGNVDVFDVNAMLPNFNTTINALPVQVQASAATNASSSVVASDAAPATSADDTPNHGFHRRRSVGH
jgi:hypothetical protein